MPTAADLDAAGIDLAVLFAGDGTINAALCALASWQGGFLILPGGTMNLLARALHGEADPAAIVAAAHGASRRVALPMIEAGPHRAFVGLILGPAAHWYRAREMARAGRPRRMLSAALGAWRRTFGRGIRIAGAPGLRARYQAVFVQPGATRLSVAAIDARDWRAIVQLGWDWLTGDWVRARAVDEAQTEVLRLAEGKPVLALFDGEPVRLEPGTRITPGLSRKAFIATLPEVDGEAG
ncbi:diacylglycerol kinase family enzyme [Sphingomonas zeicaulis]